jgi:hypothetical protein
MVFPSQAAEGFLDVVGARIANDAEHRVIVFEGDGHGKKSRLTSAFRIVCGRK